MFIVLNVSESQTMHVCPCEDCSEISNMQILRRLHSLTLNNKCEKVCRAVCTKLTQTWSRFSLRGALDHRVTRQTGQNHGGHDLVHLHRLWAAETGDSKVQTDCRRRQFHVPL